jgi:hypothetical protein
MTAALCCRVRKLSGVVDQQLGSDDKCLALEQSGCTSTCDQRQLAPPAGMTLISQDNEPAA